MSKDDDILMGVSIAPSTDSDGDGVSDAQERLDGTDPGDAGDNVRRDPTLELDVIDPRGDLERATLEREVAFDATANMPEGMSIDSGLQGLTNVDGTALSTGPNRFGVGDDNILDGRLDANSPLNMDRDPLDAGPSVSDASASGAVGVSTATGSSFTQGSGISSGPGSTPPEGADLSFRAPNMDLVSGDRGGISSIAGAVGAKFGRDVNQAIAIAKDYAAAPEAAYDAFVREATKPAETPPPPKPDPPKSMSDPDADTGGAGPGDGTPLVIIDGPRVVEGFGGGPHIEGDSPPVRYIDLVTDGGDGSVDTSSTEGTLRGEPDAPVIHTINPDAGVVQPPTSGQPPSGGGDDGDLGLYGSSDAATAASVDAPDALGINLAGSGGGGGIGSMAPAAQPPDLVSEVRDPTVRPVGNVGAQHSAPDAVDRFAKEYLEDASLEAPIADPFVASGLTADLGADLAAVPDDLDFRRLDDLDVDSSDGLAGFDGDHPLDP